MKKLLVICLLLATGSAWGMVGEFVMVPEHKLKLNESINRAKELDKMNQDDSFSEEEYKKYDFNELRKHLPTFHDFHEYLKENPDMNATDDVFSKGASDAVSLGDELYKAQVTAESATDAKRSLTVFGKVKKWVGGKLFDNTMFRSVNPEIKKIFNQKQRESNAQKQIKSNDVKTGNRTLHFNKDNNVTITRHRSLRDFIKEKYTGTEDENDKLALGKASVDLVHVP